MEKGWKKKVIEIIKDRIIYIIITCAFSILSIILGYFIAIAGDVNRVSALEAKSIEHDELENKVADLADKVQKHLDQSIFYEKAITDTKNSIDDINKYLRDHK